MDFNDVYTFCGFLEANLPRPYSGFNEMLHINLMVAARQALEDPRAVTCHEFTQIATGIPPSILNTLTDDARFKTDNMEPGVIRKLVYDGSVVHSSVCLGYPSGEPFFISKHAHDPIIEALPAKDELLSWTDIVRRSYSMRAVLQDYLIKVPLTPR